MSILSSSVVWAPAFCFEQPGLRAGQSIKLLSAQTLREAQWGVQSGDYSEERSHSIVYNQKANTVLNTQWPYTWVKCQSMPNNLKENTV